MPRLCHATLYFILATCPCVALTQAQDYNNSLQSALQSLDRNTDWRTTQTIEVSFDTHHPQGFAIVGDYLFVSSVEIIERARRYPAGSSQYDRSTGRGKGHLFKMDLQGRLIDRIEIGRDSVYHPGGIDFDGRYLWVPVAEYRPNSSSIIYRVDPATMTAEEVFSFTDHIGGIVHDLEHDRLWGVSWGSRTFYTWQLSSSTLQLEAPESSLNLAHYIDYQDCQYAGDGLAACTGVASLTDMNGQTIRLGGLEMIDMDSNAPVHQVPILRWTETGLPYTQNPMALKVEGDVLRFYLMPEDNRSRLFILESKRPK